MFVGNVGAALAADGPLFSIGARAAHRSLEFIVYGDMRFTAPTELTASVPGARKALVERIAELKPDAVFLTGDVPWHGGTVDDYAVYQSETRVWRDAAIPVFPALGNHEFAGCEESRCLENWWNAFPDLRGRRWYDVALGDRLRAIALDTDASLAPDAPQRVWLDRRLSALPKSVRFVVLYMHHPPVADLASGALASHNPRDNERALVDDLAARARSGGPRFVVVAGHIHNYERFSQGGVTYLVSGGGGARAYPVERSAQDLYRRPDAENFHFVRFRLEGDRLGAEMVRLSDPYVSAPHDFETADRFEVVWSAAGARR
jgi:hypothetical protein